MRTKRLASHSRPSQPGHPGCAGRTCRRRLSCAAGAPRQRNHRRQVAWLPARRPWCERLDGRSHRSARRGRRALRQRQLRGALPILQLDEGCIDRPGRGCTTTTEALQSGASLATPGAEHAGAEALPCPSAVQDVVPAAAGLPSVVSAATTRPAGQNAADRAEPHRLRRLLAAPRRPLVTLECTSLDIAVSVRRRGEAVCPPRLLSLPTWSKSNLRPRRPIHEPPPGVPHCPRRRRAPRHPGRCWQGVAPTARSSGSCRLCLRDTLFIY